MAHQVPEGLVCIQWLAIVGIGQDKEVTVYRLIAKDTYEENLFQTASRKYGERTLFSA